MIPLGSGLLAVALAETAATAAGDSLVDRVAQVVVDQAPLVLVEETVRLVGTRDKPLLRALVSTGAAGVLAVGLPRTKASWQVVAGGAALCLLDLARTRLAAAEQALADHTQLGRADVVLDPPMDGAEDWPHVTPLVTEVADFYVTDVNLRPPAIDPTTWTLTIEGFGTTTVMDLDGLVRLGMAERDALLACVHNRLGWDRLGQQRWTGVPLAHVLHHAGVLPASPEGLDLVMEAVDGYRQVLPLGEAVDARAWVVLGMGGRPLTPAHGFPARILTPGVFGQYGGVKWLTRLAVEPAGSVEATWVERGWPSETAWIRPMARIDWPPGPSTPPRLPRPARRVPAGPTVVVGTAWAPPHGVAAVEVSVDDGDWVAARLADPLNADSWRRWRVDVTLPPGRHALRARCRSADGTLQDGTDSPPFPSGATGWHTVEVVAA